MTEKKKEKKTDIYSLYQRTKIIKHKDDQGREVSILLQKMTQRERADALEKYYEVQEKTRTSLKEREDNHHFFENTLKIMTKDDLVQGILRYEKIRREQIVDLYPLEKREPEKEKELLSNWEETRKKELDAKTQEELLKSMIEISIESAALIEAGRVFDNACLCFMCRDPDSKERIFKSPDGVDQVLDRRVLDWLLKELTEFRKFETQKEIRETVEDESFFPSGESQKKLADSQVTAG